MNLEKYLERINFTGNLAVDEQTLITLHEHHVFYVPFENLDIHYKRPFDLESNNIYQKVVTNFRGGFCYELNSLFHTLLKHAGFNSRIISARIVDESGTIGPEYDHMCLCVDVQDKRYLADVGYGDLFVKPLEIKEGKQNDGRNEFTIQRLNNVNFMLSMSSNKVNFQQKYTFNLTEVPIERFKDICLDKQINPGSYFVKNMVCTKPTTSGRVTLFNDKFIEKKADVRIEEPILNDDELRSKLRNTFGIVIKR